MSPGGWLRLGLTRGIWLVLVAFLGVPACGGGAPPPKVAPSKQSAVCGVDDTREHVCEDLVTPTTSMPAPAPYDSCPSVIDEPESLYDPPPSVGVFDESYTTYSRKRAPPGHSCCYSWCRKVTLADPRSPSIQQSCAQATAFREQFCMEEPEMGTSLSVGAPFDHCPQAIVPPAKGVFSAPAAALFDAAVTAADRSKGESHCCYSWCSQAPPGSGILGKPPPAPKKKRR